MQCSMAWELVLPKVLPAVKGEEQKTPTKNRLRDQALPKRARKKPANTWFTGLKGRSGLDSNPRTLADQTISSRSRYDHFDTTPYLSQHQHLGKRGELMGRTSKNIKLRIPEKPRKIKGFRTGSYRVATTISSRSRYDHFDTAAFSLRCYQPNYYAITFGVLQGIFSYLRHILLP